MSSASVNHILREIESLALAEKAELIERLDLDTLKADALRLTQRDPAYRLLSQGLMVRLPAGVAGNTTRATVEVQGQPLSEQILEERR